MQDVACRTIAVLGRGDADGFVSEQAELQGVVEHSDVDATDVGSFLVDVGVVRHPEWTATCEVAQDGVILHFAHSHNHRPILVAGNGCDGSRQIVEFLPVVALGPMVFAFRQELFVVLERIVLAVKQVFYVPPHHPLSLCLKV